MGVHNLYKGTTWSMTYKNGKLQECTTYTIYKDVQLTKAQTSTRLHNLRKYKIYQGTKTYKNTKLTKVQN